MLFIGETKLDVHGNSGLSLQFFCKSKTVFKKEIKFALKKPHSEFPSWLSRPLTWEPPYTAAAAQETAKRQKSKIR